MGTIRMPHDIRYIDGDAVNGIDYDWRLIRRNYRALGCPPDVYDPTTAPLEQCRWIVNLSDRSAGKTTNWLLMGLIMYRMYGTQIQYVRNGADEIAPKNCANIMATIIDCGYIARITDGQYNTVVYRARRWYLARTDDAGTVVDRDDTHCMFAADVYGGETIKSAYNAPRGDVIIFDEFISTRWVCQFVKFCDLCKTFVRDRRSATIIMLSNTIDKYSKYFNDLEIVDDISAMRIGDNRIITTARGTNIYVDIIGITDRRRRRRQIVNQLYFGFTRPEMSAITGDDWAMTNAPHIPDGDADMVYNNIYISYADKLARLDVVDHATLGICVYVHWATRTYDDSIILTLDDIYDPRAIYRLGTGRLRDMLLGLYTRNKYYYAANDVATYLASYLTAAKSAKIRA